MLYSGNGVGLFCSRMSDRKMWRLVGTDAKACTYKNCKISEDVVVKCYKPGNCTKCWTDAVTARLPGSLPDARTMHL